MKRFILFYLLIFLSAVLTHAGSPVNDSCYLGEVPGAAAVGMGEAYAAGRGNAFSPYWNPARINTLKESVIGFSLNMDNSSQMDTGELKDSMPLEGRTLNFLSVCGPQVGIYYRPLSNRSVTSVDPSGSVTEKTEIKISQIGVSVAVPHNEKTDFGMNINFISGMSGRSVLGPAENIAEISSGYGWSLDWGLIYKLMAGLDMGLTLLNGPGWVSWEDYGQDRLPPIFRGGLNMKIGGLLNIEADYENGIYDDSVDRQDILHFGFENLLGKYFTLRAGLYGHELNDELSSVYSAGIGFYKDPYRIDIGGRQYYVNGDSSNRTVRIFLSGEILF